jgi:hypothetical protein
MRRSNAALLACAALAAAAFAPGAHAANVSEIGYPTAAPFPQADCPENCQAVAQLSGMQVKLGKATNPFRITKPGYIVAFTVRLAKPTAEQVGFFKSTYGNTPSVRIGIVRSLKRQHKFRLYRQSPVMQVEKYFGSTPTFVLKNPLRATQGDIVVLTVPTWVPAFAHLLDDDFAWRSSHSGDDCTAQNPPAAVHDDIKSVRVYGCLYRTARLLYSATFVADPKVPKSSGK